MSAHPEVPAWVAGLLNRRVTVEQVLFDVAAGKRAPLSADECRELALKLGIPEEAPQPAATLGERARELLASAYAAGFAATREGYNAEFPFDGDFEGDLKWSARRDERIATLLSTAGATNE
jgi:hypothetical protein